LLIIVNVVQPIWYSEALLVVLQKIFVIRVYVTLIILLIIQNVHAEIVFRSYVVISNDEVYVASSMLEVAFLDSDYGLVLHEGGGVTPVVGDHAHRVEVTVEVANLINRIDPAVTDQHSFQVETEGTMFNRRYVVVIIF